MKKATLIFLSALLLASCGNVAPRLQTGTYSATTPIGVLCVDLSDGGKCNIYLSGFDGHEGTYSISGWDISIKGYASRPDPSSQHGTTTERWSQQVVLTGHTGTLVDDRTFNIVGDVFVPLKDKDSIPLTFTKQ